MLEAVSAGHPREKGWVAALTLGILCSAFEVLRILGYGERHVEWWASSWVLCVVGLLGLAALIAILRSTTFTLLEGAAALFTVSLPLVLSFAIVEASTDGYAPASAYRSPWLNGTGCMGPSVTVGGRLTGVELATGLCAAAAIGLLRTPSAWHAWLRVLISSIVSGAVYWMLDAPLLRYGLARGFGVVALAFALTVLVMSWRSRGTRVVLARLFAVLTFALATTGEVLAEVTLIHAEGAMGVFRGRPSIERAAIELAQIEAPLPAYGLAVLALLGLVALGAVKRDPTNVPVERRAPSSAAPWLGLGVVSILFACVAHVHAEKQTFERVLRGAATFEDEVFVERYGSVPTVEDVSMTTAQAVELRFVTHVDEPARQVAIAADGRIEHVSGEGDAVRVIVDEANTAQTFVRALAESGDRASAYEIVLDRQTVDAPR
jgi:hypothetical protein